MTRAVHVDGWSRSSQYGASNGATTGIRELPCKVRLLSVVDSSILFILFHPELVLCSTKIHGSLERSSCLMTEMTHAGTLTKCGNLAY